MSGRTKRMLATAASATLLMTGNTSVASAHHNDNHCPLHDTGVVDVSGEVRSVGYNAPDGLIVSGYCVKAGSVKRAGLGPIFVKVDPSAKTVTISHPSGKAVSHYSVMLAQDKIPPPPNETVNPGDNARFGRLLEDGVEYVRVALDMVFFSEAEQDWYVVACDVGDDGITLGSLLRWISDVALQFPLSSSSDIAAIAEAARIWNDCLTNLLLHDNVTMRDPVVNRALRDLQEYVQATSLMITQLAATP